ncbi:MFS transporter [Altererythrobacter sp. KTW20L]|uniref:MFS transporter n=1 Tax=Altererythrobacter sp. KTW20L TaxID=2942210 RepID=UPI0020C16564|nr:MFS transporter [Altererythrobacter sp. KTW20L]MCL6249852.1 MFS transporter [Altererythrobacter sp. KTW20L]
MASIPARRSALILTQSKALRLVTLVLFYFTQGFPIGLFFYAVPTWMAANGAGTADIATVVSIAAMPWSLKFVNGFFIDRYTFLPMGRRRVWIIGAQSLIVVALVVGAVLAPAHSNVMLLATIGFCANAAVTFQDVGIDSLAVDIMPEDERAKAGGIMGGAQIVGISATTAAGGYLLTSYGITVALLVGTLVPGLVMLFGIAIREREGERRLPWTRGGSHPRNLDIHVGAWLPLLKTTFRAAFVPISLLLVLPLITRSIPAGGFEAFHPVMFQQTGGWEATEYTNFISTLGFVAGIFGMFVGGALVDRAGAQRSLAAALVLGIALTVAMALAQPWWSDSRVLVGYSIGMEFVGIIYFVAMIPMAMRMCTPAIAATQFTIYMAVGNFGRPIGASLAGLTAGQGSPQLFYWSVAALWAIAAAVALFARFPGENAAEHEVARKLPQGEGPAPIEN